MLKQTAFFSLRQDKQGMGVAFCEKKRKPDHVKQSMYPVQK